eukprot:TRINITY_DN81099_c0_g1_i1.p1 TRINITY_DN81099_c0_g1~~TRINITY_DN81099_c0_g1_i1.p1  ORF type:complete len:106 (+),score=4.24 TRINITY_DN81099_c0_g1_i1:106-423(+)
MSVERRAANGKQSTITQATVTDFARPPTSIGAGLQCCHPQDISRSYLSGEARGSQGRPGEARGAFAACASLFVSCSPWLCSLSGSSGMPPTWPLEDLRLAQTARR